MRRRGLKRNHRPVSLITMSPNVDEIVASLEKRYASGVVPRAADFHVLRFSGEPYARALRIAYRYGFAPDIYVAVSAGYWTQIAVNDAFEAGLDFETAIEDWDRDYIDPYVAAAAYANGATPNIEWAVQSYKVREHTFLAVSHGAKITFEQVVVVGSLDVLIAAYEKGALAPSEDHVGFMVHPGGDYKIDDDGVSVVRDFFDPLIEEGTRTLVAEAFVAAYKAGLPATAEHLTRVRLMHSTAQYHVFMASPGLAREHVRARILEGAYLYGGLTPERDHVSGRATKKVYARALILAARRATMRRLVARVTNDDVAEVVMSKVPYPDAGPKKILDVRFFTPAGLRELGFPETAYIRDSSRVEDIIDQRRMCRMAGADMSVAFDAEAIDRAFRANFVPGWLLQFGMDRCWTLYKTIYNRKLVRDSIKRLRRISPGATATVLAEAKADKMFLCDFVKACFLQDNGLFWRMVRSVSQSFAKEYADFSPSWLDEFRRLETVVEHAGIHWLPYDFKEVLEVVNSRLRTPEMKEMGITGMASCESIEAYERGKAMIARCARVIEEHRGSKALDAATHVFKSSGFGRAPSEALFGRLEIAKSISKVAPDIPDDCLRELCGHTGAVEFVKHAAAIGARVNASVDAILRSFKFKPSRLAIMARFLDGIQDLQGLDPITLPPEVRHGVTACLRAANPDKDVNMTSDRYVVITRERPQACPVPESAGPIPEVVLDERVPELVRHDPKAARLYRYLRVSLPGVRPGTINGMAFRGEGLDLVAALDALPVQEVRDEFILNLFVRGDRGRVNVNARWTYRQPNVIDDVLALKRLLEEDDPVRALGSCPTVAQVNGLACYLAAKGSRLVSSTYNVWNGRFVDADFRVAG